MTLARAFIVGRLARDPSTKYLANEMVVTQFAVAVDGRKKDDAPSFFDVTCFGKTAEIVQKYWTKGKPIILDGELRQEKWAAPDGSNRSKVVVVADRVQFVPRDSTSGEGRPATASTNYSAEPAAPVDAGPGGDSLDSEPPF